MSLVKEASKNVDEFIKQDPSYFFIFVGHSLGGTAAQCLAGKYQNSRSVSLNGGAAASNPVLAGPGPSKARHYHIMGDLVSTHMGPQAAEVIRIGKKNRSFSVEYPHSSDRFLAKDGAWEYVTADIEDEAWRKWGQGFNDTGGRIAKGVLKFTSFLKGKRLPSGSPIPGSRRWLRETRK